jgi:hypothetical protein
LKMKVTGQIEQAVEGLRKACRLRSIEPYELGLGGKSH